MVKLWRWHAAEETEHKAVAFDVYRAVGGPWWERCLVMLSTTLVFWSLIFMHQLRLMRADGILFSFSEWKSLLWYLLLSPWRLPQLIGPYLAYYRPSFHPSELESENLLRSWRMSLAE